MLLTSQQRIRLQTAFDMFLLDVESRRLTEHTRKFYVSTLSRFIAYLADQGIEHVHEVQATHIRQFLAGLDGLSSHTQHKYARAIKTFCNFCVRDELLEKSPADRVLMPKLEQKVLRSFAPDEVRRILKACVSERDKAIVLLLLDTGLRASELVALDVQDVDISTGALTVHRGKGQKGRVVYVGARTRKQLVRYLGSRREGVLFMSQRNKRLTAWGLDQAMKRVEQRSGVPGVTPHAFRRTFAIEFLRGGGNVHVLAKLMGHSGIDVLKRYLAFTQDDLREAHKRYGVVDNMS